MIIPTGRAGPVSGVLRTGDWPPSHVLAYTVCNTSTGLHRSAKLQTDRLEEKTIQDIMRRNEVLKEIVGTGYYQSIIYRSIKTSQYPIIKDTEKSV